MKKITTSCLLWLPMAFMLVLSGGLSAQCGVTPTNSVGSGVTVCNGVTVDVVITPGLLGGPYNIQPIMDYQFPTAPIAPYVTNYSGSSYTITNMSAGTYTIYVVDVGHGGCYDSTMFTITQEPILNFTQGMQFPDHCGDLTQIQLTMTGGTAPYVVNYTSDGVNYSMTGSSTLTVPVGAYAFKLTDALGCEVDQSATVYGIAANDQSHWYVGLCGVTDSTLSYEAGSGGSLTVNRTVQLLMKGIGSYSDQLGVDINWGDGSAITTYTNTVGQLQQFNSSGVGFAHTYTATGVYQVTYSYYNLTTPDTGQVVEFISFDSDVYPGDANSDGLANNMDVLNIGLGFSAMGNVRPGAVSTWIGQPCPDWTTNFASGLNYKYADCDGNGSIDFVDTTVIANNYGLSHIQMRLGDPGQLFADVNDPTLAIRFPGGNYPSGTPLNIPISLGTPGIPANNVYGIAFTVHYPAFAIDASNVSINFNGSWMGSGTNLVHIAHNFSGASSIDVGISRNNHSPVSGSGNICSMNVITIDNVSGKLLANNDAYFTFSNVRLIDNMGNELPVNTMGDTISVAGTTGIAGQAQNSIAARVYPNPAKESFSISAAQSIDEVVLTDLLGHVLMHAAPNEKEVLMSTEQFEKGLYLLRIRSGATTETRKIEISK